MTQTALFSEQVTDPADPYRRLEQTYPMLSADQVERVQRLRQDRAPAPTRLPVSARRPRGRLLPGPRGVDRGLRRPGHGARRADRASSGPVHRRARPVQQPQDPGLRPDGRGRPGGAAHPAQFRRMLVAEPDIAETVTRALILRRVGMVAHARGGVTLIGAATRRGRRPAHPAVPAPQRLSGAAGRCGGRAGGGGLAAGGAAWRGRSAGLLCGRRGSWFGRTTASSPSSWASPRSCRPATCSMWRWSAPARRASPPPSTRPPKACGRWSSRPRRPAVRRYVLEDRELSRLPDRHLGPGARRPGAGPGAEVRRPDRAAAAGGRHGLRRAPLRPRLEDGDLVRARAVVIATAPATAASTGCRNWRASRRGRHPLRRDADRGVVVPRRRRWRSSVAATPPARRPCSSRARGPRPHPGPRPRPRRQHVGLPGRPDRGLGSDHPPHPQRGHRARRQSHLERVTWTDRRTGQSETKSVTEPVPDAGCGSEHRLARGLRRGARRSGFVRVGAAAMDGDGSRPDGWLPGILEQQPARRVCRRRRAGGLDQARGVRRRRRLDRGLVDPRGARSGERTGLRRARRLAYVARRVRRTAYSSSLAESSATQG